MAKDGKKRRQGAIPQLVYTTIYFLLFKYVPKTDNCT